MPLHQRKLIRDRVVQLLRGRTAAGERVWANRFLPLRNQELPAVLVYALDESVDPDSALTAPRTLTRRLSLSVDAIVAATSEGEIDDALDALGLEIEEVLHRDRFLGTFKERTAAPAVDDGIVADSMLTDTDRGHEVVGDRLCGRLAHTFEVTYQTDAPTPLTDDELDDFRQVDQDYSLDGAQAALDQASDFIVIPEPEEE